MPYKKIIIGILIIIIFVLSIALYNPSITKIRHFIYLAFNKEVLSCPQPSVLNTIWQGKDSELYQKEWSDSHIVSRKLNVNKSSSNLKFKKMKNRLNSYKPLLTSKELGLEYMPYAGITAGDINHDGYLDLVLAKINQKIRVLINTHNNDFEDVTGCIFEGEIPEDVEYVALADMNNDSWLDLIVVYSQYKKPKNNTIYYFNPETHKFYDSKNYFGEGKKSVGGIALYDINKDKKLDFYVSFGLDWLSPKGNYPPHYTNPPFKDEFWVSDQNGWRQSLDKYFPDIISRNSNSGMTATFTDINQDGLIDFLLGNDFMEPSFTLLGGKQDKFSLIDKNKIPYNAFASMTYFSLDLDNDGFFELYEVGVSHKEDDRSKLKTPYKFEMKGGEGEFGKIQKDFTTFIKNKERGGLDLDCSKYKNFYINAYCGDLKATLEAKWLNKISLCDRVLSGGMKAQCKREIWYEGTQNKDRKEKSFFDSNLFPPKKRKNALLKYDKQKEKYISVDDNDDAYYTDFTWNAYPFDINNDGLQDIYIGNGFTISSHDKNRLLMNHSQNGKIILKDEAKEYGVDLDDDTRGIIIADFDNDGDGEIVVNNFLSEAKYFENKIGGDSIEVELRAKNSNYYAIGATLKLFTSKGIQVREINQGGHWDTAQPFIQHFGVPKGDQVKYIEISWPDGHKQEIDNLSINNKYVIYE